jgi:hypothetical protein
VSNHAVDGFQDGAVDVTTADMVLKGTWRGISPPVAHFAALLRTFDHIL